MKFAAILGAGLVAWLWLAPLEAWMAPFAAHMLRHIALVSVAAPLLVMGLPRLGRALAGPALLAALIEFAIVWGWHLPQARLLALSSLGFAAEQALFLGAGLLVWASALRADQPLAGAGALLLTSMHMTALGALLVLAPRDLYAEICGTAPDTDGQRFGGIVMLAIGTPAYLAGGLAVVRRSLVGEVEA